MPDPILKPPIASPERLEHGRKNWQKINFYATEADRPAPLVVAVTGNVWKGWGSDPMWIQHRLNEEGYSVAVVPFGESSPKASEVAEYYASAIAFLREKASELDIDPDRIVLMGTGDGAHFAALLGTDPRFLENAGVPFGSLQGIVGINGTGFDIPRRAEESDFLKSQYRRTFGRSPADQRRLSPVVHLDPPNAPAFLMMAQEDDRDARPQTKEMAEALKKAGIETQFIELPAFKKERQDTYFLAEPEGAGSELLSFLRTQFGVEALDRPGSL
ncbi:alpha/beta hydrolase family protein [Altericroceibacterium xinjiangense]|uniref:alpha/beta hydrolase family protein n=1 Tax=Altericroceibacterium xinjiangense TaxID=762261 RepID=UPI000F7F8BED|nr:alpha/beta hydrolase fold domain-containing protein [Altericroceibacterium xinjiangense]